MNLIALASSPVVLPSLARRVQIALQQRSRWGPRFAARVFSEYHNPNIAAVRIAKAALSGPSSAISQV
jgi:hypothetical protein